MSIETRAAFEKVKPIILKLKRHYYFNCGIEMTGYKKDILSYYSY
ncbi:hypothetical protein MGAS37826_00650 [Streptococcus pyogenes]